jgi:hypothetical protein
MTLSTGTTAACPAALRAWGSDDFAAVLGSDIRAQAPGVLPLNEATGRGGYIDPGTLHITVIMARDDGRVLNTRVGVFFQETVGGCSCGDDPAAENAYCELLVSIDKATAEAVFRVVAG